MIPTDVFLLWHVRHQGNERLDTRLIGVYSTPESAEAARDRASILSEFQGAGTRFEIDPFVVDLDYWQGSLDHWLPKPGADRPTLASCRGKLNAAELISRITSETVHPETDWGPPVGREILPPWEGDTV